MAQTTSEVWDSRWSATERAIDPEVADNFFEEYKLVKAHRAGGMSITRRGGKEISVRLETSGGTAESFDKYDPLAKAPIDPFESAHYKRRYYAVPIILSDTEDWENSGKEQVFDLLEHLGRNARKSLLKAINEDIAGAQAGKNMLGYQDLMADAAGATIGGINSTTSTWWESQRYTTAKTFTTQTVTNIYNGFAAWDDIMDKIRIQGGNPSRICTTYSIVRAYRQALASQGYARTTTSGNVKGGINVSDEPPYMGAEVMADNDIAALHSYHWDPAALKLNVISQANFRKTPFVSLQPNGQMAQLAYMVAGVQLTTNNRRRLGVATAITGA